MLIEVPSLRELKKTKVTELLIVLEFHGDSEKAYDILRDADHYNYAELIADLARYNTKWFDTSYTLIDDMRHCGMSEGEIITNLTDNIVPPQGKRGYEDLKLIQTLCFIILGVTKGDFDAEIKRDFIGCIRSGCHTG